MRNTNVCEHDNCIVVYDTAVCPLCDELKESGQKDAKIEQCDTYISELEDKIATLEEENERLADSI